MLPKEILQGREIGLYDLKCPFYFLSFFMTLLILQVLRVFQVAKLTMIINSKKRKKNDVLVSQSTHNKVPQIGWDKTTKLYYLTILDDKSLQSKSQQDHAPSEGSKKESFFIPDLLTSGDWLAILESWLAAA